MSNSLGLDHKSISYDDLKHSDLIFVIGANPTSNHPKFAEILRRQRENGGNIIAVNPSIESELNKLTTHYCQPNIGGDVALFTGVSKCLIENGQIDVENIKENIDDFRFNHYVELPQVIKKPNDVFYFTEKTGNPNFFGTKAIEIEIYFLNNNNFKSLDNKVL